MTLRRAGLTLVLIAFAGAAWPQDRDATLADMKQELTTLSVEMQRLRRELSTTGGGMSAQATGPALQRLDLLEGQLRTLTSKTEELEHRITRVVEDGTNRISDLEFRLTELKGGDLGSIPDTPTLGGQTSTVVPSAPKPDQTVQLAMNEQSDFETALKLVQEGTPADALGALDRFIENYPRSPLAAEAQFYRAQSLRAVGDTANAGRAFLESFSLAETTNPGLAADALYNLGDTLATLGETREACLTLQQVGVKFPGTAAVTQAQSKLGGMTCP